MVIFENERMKAVGFKDKDGNIRKDLAQIYFKGKVEDDELNSVLDAIVEYASGLR